MSQFASRLKKWMPKSHGYYNASDAYILSTPYFQRKPRNYQSAEYLERQRKLSAIRAELQQTEGHVASETGSSELIKEVLSQSPAQSLAEVIDDGTYIDMSNGIYVETENKEPDYAEIAENEPLYEEIGPSSQLLRTSSAESPPAVNYDSLWELIARKGMQSEKVKK